jgi:hypothetical protein
MYVGDVVTIYKFPLTKEHPEGEAKLINWKSFDVDTQLHTWDVIFLKDDRLLERDLLL